MIGTSVHQENHNTPTFFYRNSQGVHYCNTVPCRENKKNFCLPTLLNIYTCLILQCPYIFIILHRVIHVITLCTVHTLHFLTFFSYFFTHFVFIILYIYLNYIYMYTEKIIISNIDKNNNSN